MASVPKTNQAKQLLVRYIREHNLQCGDRLPSQETLRRAFKFGTATITTAVSELQKEGVLEVRDKIGVYVREPSTDGHISYTVALVSRHSERNIFYSSLITTIQHKLSECGCMLRLFVMSKEKWSNDKLYLELDDFSGLRRHVENRSIDALIHVDDFDTAALDFIHSRNIPTVFLGSTACSNAPCGVLLEHGESLRNVFRSLDTKAPQRISLLLHPAIMGYIQETMEAHYPGRTTYVKCTDTASAREFGATISRMKREERPDAIIYIDDIMAGVATAVMVQELPQGEIPLSIFLCPTPRLIHYPVKNAMYFCYDFEKYLDDALELLQKALTTKQCLQEKRLHHHVECRSSEM